MKCVSLFISLFISLEYLPFSHVVMKCCSDLCLKAKNLNVRWDFWKG